MARWRVGLALLVHVASSNAAQAQGAVTTGAQAPPGAASAAAGSSAVSAPVPAASPTHTQSTGTCVERLPDGKARPKLTEKFPAHGVTGHALTLELVVEHGPGETVLPGGFKLDAGGDDYKALEGAHFFIPDPRGPAKPTLTRSEEGGRARTTVQLQLVPLPDKPGRQELTLPALPIAISRASGEMMTLCTSSHALIVDDPIANDPNPKPKPNPAPRRQFEEWTLAKHVTYAGLIALALGALLALIISRWMRRPKKVAPPPPPRPPWEVALEGLFDVGHSGLLREQRYGEFYERVSDIIRQYLGDRYGYEGLESTTREALAALRRVSVPFDVWVKVQEFMQDADLVKFARNDPTEAQCASALTRAEALVALTRPALPLGAPQPGSADGTAADGASGTATDNGITGTEKPDPAPPKEAP
ncbi:MAG TPA: hypothetical protein VFQ61_26690 [Polyangiaceae bacterium]|nr:hypothetical protein [Polyangiaceae bacterium]